MPQPHEDPLAAYERETQQQLDRAAVEVASALRRWAMPRASYRSITTCTTLGAVIIEPVATFQAAEHIAPIVRATLLGELEHVAVAIQRDRGIAWHIAVLACQCQGDIDFYSQETYRY